MCYIYFPKHSCFRKKTLELRGYADMKKIGKKLGNLFTCKLKNKKTSIFKSFKTGRAGKATASTFFTVMFIICVILVNMIVGIINNRFSLDLDLTKHGFYTLSDETIQYISNLDKNVSINIINTKQAFCAGDSSVTNSSRYFTQASSIIEQFAHKSDKISVNYIDTASDPGFTSQFSEHEFYGNEVVVMVEDKHKIIDSYDLFEFGNSASSSYSYSYSISSSKAEQTITSAILNLSSDVKTKATFLTGYSEGDYSSFETLLEENNYEVEQVDVISGSISEDSKLLIIFGPKKDYDKIGIQKINDFIQTSGNKGVGVVYIASAESDKHANINKFLSDYGMSVEDGIAYSTDKKTQMASSGGYIPHYCSTTFADDEYTEGLADKKSPVLSAQSHPINILNSEKASSLLNIEKGGISKSQLSDFDENADKEDICVAAISKVQVSTEPQAYNYIMTVGSDLDFYETLLSYTSLSNSTYFTNIFNKITGTESGVVISPKSAESSNLGATAFQAYTISAIMVALIPLIILIYGIVTWAVRRHR